MIWQLIGRNNRILGVSPIRFADLAGAMKAAMVVRDRARRATIEVSPDFRLKWRWAITDADGRVLAKAARSYERRTECDQAVDRFVETALHAEIDAVVGRRGRFWGSDSGRART
ncbi:hypothetical protein Raf01_85590 [Rugosimonospora africana]|uniref:DUF1508 domain-containing protein n=1 Tax=Rugosimonospora africana TaxID=556532 RepID=A0A8J3R2L6_9ACTN|nr:hypothetical protein Raf01_85590 [Rugosimonospora africana]